MKPDRRHIGIGMTSLRTRERLIQRLLEQGIRDPRVLGAVREIPRHLFVDEALASRAYEDTALPIGNGQTISQPLTVARMTEALIAGQEPARVLEIGTGSGYQTAVLAQVVPYVYSVECVERLLTRARGVLNDLGVRNVRLCHSDGGQGWPEHAPYDAILVTAAPIEVPAALLDQLAEGGRLVMPLGKQGAQRLTVIERHDGRLVQESFETVAFVPMRLGAQ